MNADDSIPAVRPCGGMLPFQQAECEVDIDDCVGCGSVGRRDDEGEL